MLRKMLDKLDFVELVSRRVSLTKTKKDTYKGLSPFTNEKTPSFFVNVNAKTWYDFSAGKGGGVLDYIMQTEGIEKGEAIAFLAELVGEELPENNHLGSLRDVIRYAGELFAAHAEKAYPYMKERGFSEETLKRYSVGYAPSGAKTLINHLMDKGCSREDIITSGMGYVNEKGQLLSRYADRVIFPIKDSYGMTVSFTGRATLPGRTKYLHGAGSPIFRKKELVWNLSSVRSMIAEHNLVIVCEGQMDALSVCEAGLPGVAILGSSPTETQIKLLGGASSNIYFVFDSDDAGERALLESFKLAESTGIDSVLYAITLPEGEDPNSFLLEKSKDELVSLIRSARSDTSAVIRALIKQNLSATKTRVQVASAVVRELSQYIQSKLSYRGLDLIERISQEFSLDQAQLRRMIQYKNADSISAVDLGKITFPAPIYERRILYFILDNPKNIVEFQESGIGFLDFESQLIGDVLQFVTPDMNSAELFDKLREVLVEENYYTILEFYSKGLDGSFSSALEVMKVITLKRVRDNRNDFLGRPTPDNSFTRARRKELKARLALENK